MIEIVNNKIFIDCNNKDTNLKSIVIHSPNKKYINKFLEILISILDKENFKDTNKIKKIELKYYTESNNLLEGCDWYEMPEYKPNKQLLKSPFFTLYYKKDNTFIKELSDNIDITITDKTTYLWYPNRLKVLEDYNKKMYICPKSIKPKYPIYILSKGRWEKRYTSRYLDWCDIDYKIVIEPQEYAQYSRYIDKNKILVLPDKYLNKNMGGIPARNFILEHSRKNKDRRHWILDDNIMGYYRLNDSSRTFLKGGCVFKIIEDYVDRYENIKMAGHNYKMFGVPLEPKLKPITKNTRIYSSILLSNDIPFKWRGKYNEDTDLSLRILKKGFSTVLFNAILADKQQTLKQKGGNTDTIYNLKNALYLKAESLKKQHPDVAIISERFGRIHHYVDYSPFKDNNFIFKENIKKNLTEKNYNYGMKLFKKPKDLY